MEEIIVQWNRYPNGDWCNLYKLNLNQAHFNGMSGVYIIWDLESKFILYVGNGEIRKELEHRKLDKELSWYKEKNLYVTWARVEIMDVMGVERYLLDVLNPQHRIGIQENRSSPIRINLPWNIEHQL